MTRPRSSWGIPALLLAALVAWTLLLRGGAPLDVDTPLATVNGADGFPRTVELPGGRSVRLATPPSAVVPAAAGAVDLVCALLPPGRVAGLPEQALQYSGLRDASSPYLARPRFAVYEAERLLAVGPDLVLAHGWQSADTTARLRETGVEVVTLPDPRGWEEVHAQVELVGRLLGAEASADALLADYEARLERLVAARAGRRPLAALSYSNGGAGGWVAGAGTTNHEILRLAGLRNLAAEAGRTGHTSITFEELLMFDPEVFVVGGAADAQQTGGTAGLLRSEEALAGLRAVAGDRIVVLDSWLYTTLSHHLVDAAEHVVEATGAWAVPAAAPTDDAR